MCNQRQTSREYKRIEPSCLHTKSESKLNIIQGYNTKPLAPAKEQNGFIVEVDFLWNRTVDSLKTSFHPLLWTSSGLRDS